MPHSHIHLWKEIHLFPWPFVADGGGNKNVTFDSASHMEEEFKLVNEKVCICSRGRKKDKQEKCVIVYVAFITLMQFIYLDTRCKCLHVKHISSGEKARGHRKRNWRLKEWSIDSNARLE